MFEDNELSENCEDCGQDLSLNTQQYSNAVFGDSLCYKCQAKRREKQSPQSRKLAEELRKKLEADDELEGDEALVYEEFFEGNKTVDIHIPAADIDIEVDGGQHHFDASRAIADLKRANYSDEEGIRTIHLPNSLLDEQFEQTVSELLKTIRDRVSED